MKTRIYRGQYGYFIVAKNYKDKDDKQYVNIHFVEGKEPMVTGDYIDINVIDGWLTCYKGKVGFTIKEYEISKSYSNDLSVEDGYELNTEKFGGKIENISPDELPFY